MSRAEGGTNVQLKVLHLHQLLQRFIMADVTIFVEQKNALPLVVLSQNKDPVLAGDEGLHL